MMTNKIPTLVIPSHFVEEIDASTEMIKWTMVNSKYEIHTKILQSIEIEHFLPHCLAFCNKIDTIVGVKAHKVPSFLCAFPCTLSLVLHVVWDQIILDAVHYARSSVKQSVGENNCEN